MRHQPATEAFQDELNQNNTLHTPSMENKHLEYTTTLSYSGIHMLVVNDGTTRLVDRCDRVENAHASYHVDARVHVRPVFSGGVIICWHCSSQSNDTIQDYCVSVMAIRQSLKKAQEQARNSKPLTHSACSEASICKIHPTQAMVVAACSFPAPYSTVARTRFVR